MRRKEARQRYLQKYGDIARARVRERQQKLRRENPEEERRKDREYYRKNRVRIRARERKYRKERREEVNKKARERYHRNRVKIRLRARNYSRIKNREAKEEAVALLGGRCQRCGYSKIIAALEFHHKNGRRKQLDFDRITPKLLRQLKETGKIKELELVCANCHRGIHYGN